MVKSIEKVRALLDPESIAIVGASPTETGGRSWSFQVFKNLENAGYSGEVFPINPRYEEVWGRRCFPDLASLPQVPDQVLLIVPVDAALPILAEAGRLGTRSAVLYAAGFTESLTDDGARRSEQLGESLEESGIGLCGPNCMGYASFPSRSLTYPGITVDGRESEGNVGILAQSGALAGSLYRSMLGMGATPRYLVSSGNELGLTIEDYLEYFITDEQVDSVLLFVESLKQPARFIELCAQASERELPIVTVKLGMSADAQESVVAHTGRLAGNGRVFVDVARAAGVITARTIDEAVDVAALYRRRLLPKSRRLGGVTRSGGLRNVLIDSAATWQMEFPTAATLTVAKLEERIAGVGMAVGNPTDIGQRGNLTLDCVRDLAEDPNIDGIISQISTSTQGSGGAQHAEEFQPISDATGKLIVLTSYRLDVAPSLGTSGVAFCATPDRAVAGLSRLVQYREWSERTRSRTKGTTRSVVLGAGAGSLVGQVEVFDENKSKELIAEYGLATPQRRRVDSIDDAAAVLQEFGGPVILKVVSDAVPHKSAVGLLSPIIDEQEEIQIEFARLEARCTAVLPEGAPASIWAESAVLGGLECALGCSLDSDFGMVVMFGTGGALLETFDDVVFSLPLENEEAARDLIARTMIGRMLLRPSGRSFDVEALVKALLALSKMSREIEGLQAIDLNPVSVHEEGRGAVVLDASVVLQQRISSARRD